MSNEALMVQIVQSLQAVTSRLEALERRMVNTAMGPLPTGVAPPGRPGSGSSHPAGGAAPLASQAAEDLPASVTDYDNYLSENIDPLVALGKEIGGDIETQTNNVQKAFVAVRNIIAMAAKSKKPTSDAQLADVIQHLQAAITAADVDVDRRSKDYLMIQALKDGIQANLWILIEKTPLAHVKEYQGQFLFNGNKAKAEHKDKEPKRVDWVNKFKEALDNLQPYIKQYHTTGLTWNPQGGDAKAPSATSAAAAAAPAEAAPAAKRGAPAAPPPPPPMTAEELGAGKKPAAAGGDATALFAELSKGEGITSGLRHVSREERKRPAATSVVPAKEAKPASKAGAKSEVVRGPPAIEIDGFKVFVRNYVDNSDVTLGDLSMKHSIMITNCANSIIKIPGKVNSITLAGCVRTGVLCDNVMGTIELVNCDRPQVQVQENVPIIQIDTSTGLQLFLTEKNAQDIQIVTSKSAELNLSVIKTISEEETDVVEYPIPDQFLTKYKDGKLITTPNSHV